jgi:UDP:flavonoid glycosyltransferase YjiC (YdhE family)
MPITGHVNPGLPIARTLIKRGHEVAWYTGRKFRAAVEATGARYIPMERAYDFDDSDMGAAFPRPPKQSWMAGRNAGLKRIFIDPIAGQVEDLRRALRGFPADVLVSDSTFAGAGILHELGGPPWATYGISALTIQSRDTAPFTMALPPDSSALGRLRNRALAALVEHVIMRDANAHYDNVRAALGLPPLRSSVLDSMSPFLYLHPGTPAFEYPRSDLPPQVQFIGPLLPDPPAGFVTPEWWPELRDRRPVVLVTQGTIATESSDLIAPSLRALAGEDVLVIATTGGAPIESVRLDPPETGLDQLVHYTPLVPHASLLAGFGGYHVIPAPAREQTAEGWLPPNARLERFVPFAQLMPHVSVMITNGGYGGVQFALAHGVPLVVAGTTQEKPEIAARVAWSGAGINLKTRTPTPEQIRAAVRSMLENHSYRHNAERIRADYARHNAPAEAAALLEQLAATRQPILRDEAKLSRGGRSAAAVSSGRYDVKSQAARPRR